MDGLKTTRRSTCPNCHPGTAFCPECGEKRFEHGAHSFKSFFGGLFSEVTDLDSKLIRTLLLLSFRPGFLTVEYSRGVTVPYIKPLRLFLIIALVHFLAFGVSGKADMYSIDNGVFARTGLTNFLMQWAPLRGHLMTQYDTAQVNKTIKDFISIFIYLILLAAAGLYKLIFSAQHKYYSEHLIFFLHILSAAFLRNLVLLPVLMAHLPTGMVLITVLNLIYVVAAIRRFYGLTLGKAMLMIVPTLTLVGVSMAGIWSAAFVSALWR